MGEVAVRDHVAGVPPRRARQARIGPQRRSVVAGPRGVEQRERLGGGGARRVRGGRRGEDRREEGRGEEGESQHAFDGAAPAATGQAAPAISR